MRTSGTWQGTAAPELTTASAGVSPRRVRWPARRGWSILTLLLAAALSVPLLLRPATPAYGAPPAPDFKLPLVSGGHGMLALRALRGHPVLLNFFQSDCVPCLDEMPTLARAATTYRGQGLVVVGISSLGDSPNAARRLAAADRLPFPVVTDAQQSVSWQYGVASTPTSIFIDAQGRVQGQYIGQLAARLVRGGLARTGAVSCGNDCDPVETPTLGAVAPVVAASSAIKATDVFQAPFAAATPFALRDQRGRTITPRSLRGKVVVLTFISAVCTQQCPLVGRALSDVRRLLGRDAAGFGVVAISIDPAQDSPAATRHFAVESGWEGTDWHYLSGPYRILARVWKSYGVPLELPSPIYKRGAGGGIVHQAGLYLIDQRGRLRAYDDVPFLASDMASSVRALLSQ